MYQLVQPKPLVRELKGAWGFDLRQQAKKILDEMQLGGAERGSDQEQSYGILAQIVIRSILGMPLTDDKDMNLGFDLTLPSGVKVDVKCRGGVLPFQEEYEGTGGHLREAKHNFLARQVWNARLDTDIYLMTHLETPRGKLKAKLPGTERQTKWKLYVCGWVSKARVQKEGVFLPRGSVSEQGSKWIDYRAQEIEFYHKYLNGLSKIEDLLKIDFDDVGRDVADKTRLHLTKVDATRIAIDLVGRGVLDPAVLNFVIKEFGIGTTVPPILSPNQYFYFVEWLETMGKAGKGEMEKLKKIMSPTEYTGI